MKKRDFVSELLSYGVGFALTFLVMLGLAATTVLFLGVVIVLAFFERLLN